MEIPTQHEKDKPVRFTALFFGLGMGALLLAIAVWFLPIEWSEAKNRFRLWRAGARPVLWEKHRGFTLDRCGEKAPAECPCVWLVHGLGDSVSTWRRFFIDENSFTHPVRLYAIDLPGHGGSLRRKDTTEYRVSAMARELDEKISSEAKCEKNVVVGNSFGGWVATHMVLQSPKLFTNLVLIAPSGMSEAAKAGESLFTNPTIESLKDFQKRAYFKPRELPERAWEAALEKLKGGGISEVRNAQVPEDRLERKLGLLTTPTTLVYGDADRIIPRSDIDLFMEKQPAIHLRVVTECGHLPQKECPDQLFPLVDLATQ